MTELYSLYASCSIEEADKAVQQYLEKDAGELLSLFPDGILDISEKETVRMITLSRENGEKVWQRMSHPFFKAHSPEPEQSALIFYNYIIHRIYRDALWRAIGFRDHHIKYGGYSDWGYESAEKLMFVKKEQYSYHDGGGGSRSSWCMLPLSRNKQKRLRIPKDMMTKEYYSKRHLSMPPCDGYWEEEGVLYVKNPFDISSIHLTQRFLQLFFSLQLPYRKMLYILSCLRMKDPYKLVACSLALNLCIRLHFYFQTH